MDKKNVMLLTVIAVATLLVAVVGATFAYFSLTVTGTTDTTAVDISTEAIGTIALTNPTNAMHITLSAVDMAEAAKGTTYYATKTAGTAHVASAENNKVATATITGGASSTNYECTGTVNVKTTMTGGKTPSASELSGNVVLTGGSKTTLGTSGNTNTVTLTDSAAASGVDVAFKMSNLTNAAAEDITANVSFTNTTATQDSLNGATITTTLSLKDFACKVVSAASGS